MWCFGGLTIALVFLPSIENIIVLIFTLKGIAVTKGKCSGFLDLEIKSMNDPENIKSESLTDDEAAEEGPVEIVCN